MAPTAARVAAKLRTGSLISASGFRFRLDLRRVERRRSRAACRHARTRRKPFTRLETGHRRSHHSTDPRPTRPHRAHVHVHNLVRRGDCFTTGCHTADPKGSGVHVRRTSRSTARRSCSDATCSCPASSRHSASRRRGRRPPWTATTSAAPRRRLAFDISRGGRPGPRSAALNLGADGYLVGASGADDPPNRTRPPARASKPGTITFEAELSEPGRYALFLQFRHGGKAHTCRSPWLRRERDAARAARASDRGDDLRVLRDADREAR